MLKKLAWNKYGAELLGTFTLAFAVIIAIMAQNPGILPFVVALVVGLFIYTVGHISGAHLNPAITIGALSINKISIKDGIGYLLAQFAGAGIAIGIGMAFFPEFWSVLGPIHMSLENTLRIGLAEAIGMFFFAFGFAAVLYGKVNTTINGLVVGLSMLLGILVTLMLGANGILNPAVAMGIKSLNAMYILGPLVGAVAGMWAYTGFAKSR